MRNSIVAEVILKYVVWWALSKARILNRRATAASRGGIIGLDSGTVERELLLSWLLMSLQTKTER